MYQVTFFSYTAISSSSDDSDEGSEVEIKSEESDVDEKTEMVCLYVIARSYL